MKRLVILLASIVATNSSYAFAETEARKSPYFIDGVHCEGIELLVPEESLKRKYEDEEIAAVGLKTLRQNVCEAIFKEYGIEKFQWVTQEDLERLSFTLKRSNKFRSVDIRLEKSDLQSHVHLFGLFKLYEPKTHYSLDISNGLEGTQAEGGSRATVKGEGLISFGQRGPNDAAAFALGVKYFNSTASRPLNAEEMRVDNKEVTMTENERIAQGRQNGTYGAVNWRFPLLSSSPMGGGSQVFMAFGLATSRLAGDSNATFDSSQEVGVSFQSDPLLPSTSTISLLHSSISATRSDINSSDEAKRGSESGFVFAGIKSDHELKKVTMHISFYRALTSEMHYFGDYRGVVHFAEFAGINHGLGADAMVVRGAILPEHRFGLPDRQDLEVFYRGNHNFAAFGADNSAWLKVGSALYLADNKLENPYGRGQFFGELGLKTKTEDFDLGLSFLYGDRRLF